MSIVHWMGTIIAKLVATWYTVSWQIADKRVGVVVAAMLLGIVIANWLGRQPRPKARQQSRPTRGNATRPVRTVAVKQSSSKRSWRIRPLRSVIGLLLGLWTSTALVVASVVTHAADLRWLPPGQRQAPSIPAPKLPAPPNVPFVGDALKILTNAVDSGLQALATGTNTALHPILSLTTPVRAIMVAAGLVVQYGLISALSGTLVVILLVFAFFKERRNKARQVDNAEARATSAEAKADSALERVTELEGWIHVLTGNRAYPDAQPPRSTGG